MTFVTKSSGHLVTTRHVTQVPKKGFEYLKEWLATTGLPVFETVNALAWEFNLAEIRASNQSMNFVVIISSRIFFLLLFCFAFMSSNSSRHYYYSLLEVESIQWEKLLEPKKDLLQKKEVAELLGGLSDHQATKKDVVFAKPTLAPTKTKNIV
jgi:hypothetical protein